jgi:hypothetical protein
MIINSGSINSEKGTIIVLIMRRKNPFFPGKCNLANAKAAIEANVSATKVMMIDEIKVFL